MKSGDYQAVIWDLDGTLVDSAADIAEAVNRVLEESGLNPLPLPDVRMMIGNGAGKLLDRAFRVAGGMECYDAEKAYTSFLHHYRLRSCVHTCFYPGIREVLTILNQAGLSQGVCTNKPHAITLQILRQLGIEDYFGSVIGGDSTEQRKPHALPLDTCMNQLGKRAQYILMVGDSEADIGAAKASGVDIAVVPWGYSRTPADELGGDYLITDTAELLSIVKSALGEFSV